MKLKFWIKFLRFLNWGSANDKGAMQLFKQHIAQCFRAAQKLGELIDSQSVDVHLDTIIQEIVDAESQADGLKVRLHDLLLNTFITTVFEREDMFKLIKVQEHAINQMKRCAFAIKHAFLIPSSSEQPPVLADAYPQGRQFVEMIQSMAQGLHEIIHKMEDMTSASLNGDESRMKASERQSDFMIIAANNEFYSKSYDLTQPGYFDMYRRDAAWLNAFAELEETIDLCNTVMEHLASMARKRIS